MKGRATILFITIVFFTMAALAAKRPANYINIKREWRCNQYGHSIQIWDDSVTPSSATIDTITDPGFKSFVKLLSAHIASKVPPSNTCQKAGRHPSDIRLIFIRYPLVTSGEESMIPPPKLKSDPRESSCQLASPWLNLKITRTQQPTVEGIFIWNDRQFLIDQVLLSSSMPRTSFNVMPFSASLFHQYASKYAKSEILRMNPEGTQPSLAKEIPPELLWLFQHSWQSTRGLFTNTAKSSMRQVVAESTQQYIQMSKNLVDRCMSSTGKILHYSTILDLRSMINRNHSPTTITH
jgi:hypothetical protein